MAYRDLQSFMRELERQGMLKRIDTEVDSRLEITEIADRMVKRGGPALLFEHVKGSAYPLLINTFASSSRMAMALGVNDLDEIGRSITDLLDLSNYDGMIDKLKALPKVLELARVFPRHVKHAPCQEIVEDADLGTLPVLHCWPQDGGPFLTLPLVFTKDPETGVQNAGMYRMQIYSKTETGMHWHLHKDGRHIFEKYRRLGGKMPVSVALGSDPATIYAATAPLPSMIDEILFSGFLRKSPVEMVTCVSNGIEVPAHSEFVIEGWVDVDGPFREEGPFGDHTGYYSLKDTYPVFHAEKITRKKNPIYPATIVGRPPMEDCYMAKATERIFLPIIKMINPEIIDMNFPLEGVFHNCVIVSINKQYPGHAKKVMYSIWGMGQMMYTKMIIVVDRSVDPRDLSAVAWKVFNNIDARRDLVIADGPLDALDHASPLPFYGSRLGIDATKKWSSEGHNREWPDDIVMQEDIKKLVTDRWAEYGF